MFNAPAALLAARALTGDHLRHAPPEPRRTNAKPAQPAAAPATAAAPAAKRRRHGRSRLAWR